MGNIYEWGKEHSSHFCKIYIHIIPIEYANPLKVG